MDFRLDDDDRALVEATRAFCEGRFPSKVVRDLQADGGVRRDLWKELAGTGVFGLRLPLERQGAGLGFAEAVLVFEELGRALVPGPLVGTHLAAGWVEGAAEGDVVVGLVERGRPPFLVEHPDCLDVVMAWEPGRLIAVPASSLVMHRAETSLDPLTPVALADALPTSEAIAEGVEADMVALGATVLGAAQAVGIASRTLELAVDYARHREQFNRPIGSFQAVKHILADAAARLEVARAAAHAAGVLLSCATEGTVGFEEARQAAFSAKLLSVEAAVDNALASIQVHGGMGFTWEVDLHLYLKRAYVIGSHFGTPEQCAEVLAGAH